MKIKVIENTIYSLFQALLILDKNKDIEYIFPLNFNRVIIQNMLKNNKKVTISDFGSFKNGILNYYSNLIKYYYNKKRKKDKFKIYGNDIIYISIPYRECDFFLIEDGLTNYNFFSQRTKVSFLERIKRIIRMLPSEKKCYGLSENVKKIYLTGLAPIPKEIAHKVEIINLKELWDKKSLEEQNEILDIFSFDLNIKETIKDRDIILFTQPLSEDGVITEEEKIEIYSKIIKKYPQDRLIVKTHPREKTNYKEIFKEKLVLDNPFPFEILNLLDVKFNKAVTLFSTAALGLGEGIEVDFYGTEVNDKILARFGSCDNIMKRNSYLEEEE